MMLTMGLNIITGYTGPVSLGHAAFFEIGAYTSALLSVKAGVPFWLALPASGLVTSVVGARHDLRDRRSERSRQD